MKLEGMMDINGWTLHEHSGLRELSYESTEGGAGSLRGVRAGGHSNRVYASPLGRASLLALASFACWVWLLRGVI